MDEESEDFKQLILSVNSKFSQAEIAHLCKYFKVKNVSAQQLCLTLNCIENIMNDESDSSEEEEDEEEVAAGLVRSTSSQSYDTDANHEPSQTEIFRQLLQQNEMLIKTLCAKPKEFKILPNLTCNIQTFNGKEPNHEAEAWLKRLNGVAAIHEWPDSLKLETARSNLIGSAKNWFSSRDINDWKEFEERFIKTYIGPCDIGSRWKQLLQRVQLRTEDTEDYLQDKLRMCRELRLPFEETKLQIIEGIWSRELAGHLLAIKHYEEDELRSSIRQFERINNARCLRTQRISSIVGTSKSQTFSERMTDLANTAQNEKKEAVKQTICYSCGARGHIATFCDKKHLGLKCFKCGVHGHRAADCSREESSFTKEPKVNKITVEQKYNEYYKKVKVNGSYVTAFLDLGSDVVTIKKEVAEKYRLSYRPYHVTLRGFGKGHCETLGCRLLRLEVDGIEIEVDVLVVSDSAQEDDMIIGRSALEQPGLRVVKEENRLHVQRICKKSSEATIESQLSEAQALLEEETRQKLSLSSKLRQLESENDAIQEQIEEEEEAKKNLEKRIAALNQQVVEAKKKVDEETEKVNELEELRKKTQKDIETLQRQVEKLQAANDKLDKSKKKLTYELTTERSNNQKLESARMILEKQNKELKTKLNELENNQRTKTKATIAELESKISNLEEQLETEAKEKLLQQKVNRKLDKKIKDLLVQLDDERRLADQYKEQAEKVNVRLKNLKRALDEAEEEMSREKTQKPTAYEVRDLVLVRREPAATGESRKLMPFKGPYQVSMVLENDRYVLTDIPGAQRTQRPFSSIFASENMKHWCIPNEYDNTDDDWAASGDEDDTDGSDGRLLETYV